jgi:hypothetical protein
MLQPILSRRSTAWARSSARLSLHGITVSLIGTKTFPDSSITFPVRRLKFPVRLRREVALQVHDMTCAFERGFGVAGCSSCRIPCIFPANRELGPETSSLVSPSSCAESASHQFLSFGPSLSAMCRSGGAAADCCGDCMHWIHSACRTGHRIFSTLSITGSLIRRCIDSACP